MFRIDRAVEALEPPSTVMRPQKVRVRNAILERAGSILQRVRSMLSEAFDLVAELAFMGIS